MNAAKLRWSLISLVALAALVLLPSARAEAVGSPFHGIVPQGQLTPEDYDLIARGNIGNVRIPVRWGAVQPTMDTPIEDWDWSALDEQVDQLAILGARMLPVISGGAPEGANTPPTDSASRRGFARFAAALAARYGRNGDALTPITEWQVWNEQNGRAFWRARPNVRAYAKILKAVSRRIKREDPRAKIVLGGMFATPSGNGAITSWRYLRKLYGIRGAKKAFDLVAVHPYSPNLFGTKYQIRRIRRVMNRHGDRRARLRVTEIGWGSKRGGHDLNKGRRGQARMLTRAFRMIHKKRRTWRIKGVHWFSLADGNVNCPICESSGLATATGEKKPAWRAFRRATRR